jgi:hypothetical protein
MEALMHVRRLAVAALVVGWCVACGTPDPMPSRLDEADLEGERGLRDILQKSYDVKPESIESVDCPPREARQGNRFSCTVRFGGSNPKEQTVEVTVQEDGTSFTVGPPRDRGRS